MKYKILAFICLLIYLSFSIYSSAPKKARAEQLEYKRVINDQTPFFTDEKGADQLFFLPKGYYVRVLSTGENFLHVECFGEGGTPMLDGYVEKNSVINCNSPVNIPFLSLSVTTSSSCALYADTSLSQELQFVFKDRTLYYYGRAKSESGQDLILVYYNGKIGYLKESDLTPFSVPVHPEPLNLPASTENIAQTEIAKEGNSKRLDGLKTAVLVCLFLAGIIALSIALRKKDKTSSSLTYIDDDNAD